MSRPQCIAEVRLGKSYRFDSRQYEDAGCVFNFSLLVQREVARETTLRRGRFRFLPLLRTTLFETTQRGAAAPLWILPGEYKRTAVPNLRFWHRQRRERKRSPPRNQEQTGFPLEFNQHPGWAAARTEYRELSCLSRATPFSFFHRARRCLSFRARPKRKIGGRMKQAAFRNQPGTEPILSFCGMTRRRILKASRSSNTFRSFDSAQDDKAVVCIQSAGGSKEPPRFFFRLYALANRPVPS